MRRIFSLIPAMLVVGCGALQLPGGQPNVDGTVVALAQQGAPRLQVGILSLGASTVVVRQTVRENFETYASIDGASITMQDGMMIATRGLGGDMLGSDISESLATVSSQKPGRVTRFHTFLDPENRAERRAYICDIAIRGPRDVPFGETQVATQLIAEDCASQDQTFLNLYWIDSSGKIVQSRQWAGDFAGVLTFRIVP